ncbi:hypothetical protein JCM11641_006397 [Rhodosporidiobolus odoratus]
MAALLSKPFDRYEHDRLLALLDPVHFIGRQDRPTSRPPVTLAPHALLRRRTSIASSLSSRVSLSQLLISSPNPSPRPASVYSRPSLPPLLSLPPELLLHILDLCLPADHTRRTTLERGRTLACLALVHPIFRQFAQDELYHHVVLASDSATDKLRNLTGGPAHGSRGAQLGKRITSLKVYGTLGTGDGGRTLASLVHQLDCLERLHLEDLDGLELRHYAIHRSLKFLSANRCGFRSRFRAVITSRPSPLTSLSLTNITAQDDGFSGFTLPHLTQLTICDIYLPPHSPLAVLEPSEAFKPFGPQVVRQLSKLTTDEWHFSFFFPLSTTKSRTAPCALQHLHLLKLTHLSPLLDSLSTSSSSSHTPLPNLLTLHLSPTLSFTPTSSSPEKASSHFASLLSPFRVSAPHPPPSLKNAQHLVLDARYAVWLDQGNEEMRELLERVQVAGLQLVFEEGKEEDGEGGRRRGLSRGAVGPTVVGRRGSMGALLRGGVRGGMVRGGGRFAAGDW